MLRLMARDVMDDQEIRDVMVKFRAGVDDEWIRAVMDGWNTLASSLVTLVRAATWADVCAGDDG